MTTQEEIEVYGESLETAERMFNILNDPNSDYDRMFYAFVILSDAQMMIERGEGEFARQFINKAKHFMMTPMQNARSRENTPGTLHIING